MRKVSLSRRDEGVLTHYSFGFFTVNGSGRILYYRCPVDYGVGLISVEGYTSSEKLETDSHGRLFMSVRQQRIPPADKQRIRQFVKARENGTTYMVIFNDDL